MHIHSACTTAHYEKESWKIEKHKWGGGIDKDRRHGAVSTMRFTKCHWVCEGRLKTNFHKGHRRTIFIFDHGLLTGRIPQKKRGWHISAPQKLTSCSSDKALLRICLIRPTSIPFIKRRNNKASFVKTDGHAMSMMYALIGSQGIRRHSQYIRCAANGNNNLGYRPYLLVM